MNCIKRLPRSAGEYSADTEYLPQDRVSCEGSIFVSLRRQSGNRPSVTVNGDGTYDTADGWMIIAVAASVPGGGKPMVGNPSINGVELVGDKTPAELGLASAGDVPERVSQLDNDAGYLTGGRLRTVNGESLVGEGDIKVGGGSPVEVDAELSDSSENPVQNKVVTKAIDSKQDKGDYALKSEIPDVSDLAKKTDIPDISGLASKSEIPDISNLASKSEIPDITGLAKKTDIPDVSNLATKAEVSLVDTKADTNAANILKKVDKVDGKGLSTNDYTDADKTKVGKALTEHQSLGNYYTKEEVDSKVAQGGTFDPTAYYNKHDVDSLVGGKVDKIEGKQLSSNDYTDDDKAKVLAALTEHQDISGLVKTSEFKEANLGWGGRNLSDDFSPVDAAMIPQLGANRFAFLPASCWTVEYSRDGGETWIDYEATDAQKLSLTSNGTNLVIGKSSADNPSTADCMLRLTLNPIDKLYTIINKFAIYITTLYSDNCYCTIQGETKKDLDAGNDTWFTFADKVGIAGWSGWNIINYPNGITLYANNDNQYARLRFIFGCQSSKSEGLKIVTIYAFGGSGWKTPSNMARQGTIYSYDHLQHVRFPNEVIATNLHGRKSDGTTHQVAYIDDSRFTDARRASDVSAWAKAATKPTYTPDEIGAYAKPSGGIPKADLASSVQTSLGKADTALQSVPSDYRTAAAQDAIDSGKVDKVTGKGLSTNDYTDAEKTKVANALTQHQSLDNYYTKSEVDEKVASGGTFDPTDYYNKSSVDTLLDGKQPKGNYALKSEIPSVPSWAMQSTKPSYTASEVGALPSTTKIPSKTSDLSNDSGFLTSHQSLKTINGNSLVGTGDITISGGGIESYDVSDIINATNGEEDWVDVDLILTTKVFDAAKAKKLLYCAKTDGSDYFVSYLPYSLLGNTLYLLRVSADNAFNVYTLNNVGQIKLFHNEVPVNTSDLTNDSGFITSSALADYAKTSEVDAKIAAIPSGGGDRTIVKHYEDTIGFSTVSTQAGAEPTTMPEITLAANEFHIVGSAVTGFKVLLPDGSDMDGKEYICQFYTNAGSTHSLVLPDSVVWLNGEAPTIESNACYMLSIVNNCAVIGMFKESS